MVFTQASLFCGAGGLDIGFERSGFTTIWANDSNKDACETFRGWSNANVICGDISTIDANTIPDTDVILGGFPCQGFSISGARRLDDSRNSLYHHFVRIVRVKKPPVFVAENVKGLLTMGNGQVIEAITQAFTECGYTVFTALLNAKNYGVPEDRERVFIVGFRRDMGVVGFRFPEPDSGVVTLRDALVGVPSPSPGDVCVAPYSSRYMSRNRKRGWDEVSYTIPATAKQMPLFPGSPDMVKVGRDEWVFGDGVTRRLSWREAAAIQTFSLDMVFCGGLVSVYRQIGNAVPVGLAERVAGSVFGVLSARL